MKLEIFLMLAGIGQLVLGMASLAIPGQLGWRKQLEAVRPLTRQVFWTYALYILGTNMALGAVSLLGAGELLSGGLLAKAVCGFATAWWGGRVLIQFVYFDRSDAPQGLRFVLAEIALVTLFVFLTGTYAAALYRNFVL